MNNDFRQYLKNIDIKKILIIAVFGVFMQLFAMVIVTEVLNHFAEISAEYSETIDNLTKLTFKMIMYVCIIAPVFEEICFRGVVMQAVAYKLPFFAANIIQALLFSIYHDNIVQKIYAFLLGLLIGFLVHSLKNILYGITFHASMNALGVIINNFVGEIENTVIKIVIVVISAVCMALIYKNWSKEFIS